MTRVDATEMLRLHRSLDQALRLPDALSFISGWKTDHPYENEFLVESMQLRMAQTAVKDYSFLADSRDLERQIIRFHSLRDGIDINSENIYATPGSSNAILALVFALKELGFKRVHYIPPIYQTFHYYAQLIGIEMIPVADTPLLDSGMPTLPAETSALVVSDPIWIFGKRLSEQHIKSIQNWQSNTKSLVIVDGTFSYTTWNKTSPVELASILPIERTIRLVCPTKSLALHGVRFAYVILPHNLRESFRYPSSNSAGASSGFDQLAAEIMMETLISDRNNIPMIDYIKKRREELFDRKILIDEIVEPDASYFVFAKIDPDVVDQCLLMDQRFFELKDYTGYYRLNILSPALAKFL